MSKGRVSKRRGFWSGVSDNFLTLLGARSTLSDPFLRHKLMYGAGSYAWGRMTSDVKDEIEKAVRHNARYAHAGYLPTDRRPMRIGDSVYDKDNSSDTIAVYREGDKFHVGLRGTKNGTDVITDINVAGSGIPYDHSRVREVDDLLDRLNADPDNSTLYGHSLGGSIATRISQRRQIPSHNFNTGSTPLGAQTSPYSHHYVIDGDPISNSMIGNVPSSNIKLYGRSRPDRNAHTIDQFIDDEWLSEE